ncbi:helix-turn-helix domain-containing protein [Mycobacterium sp. ITM-2016-00318]|uniref:TetR/AcrR family transcriptional regulator n=1 Tax=Mycobacterium sp. ITM-2016-00318 TaxID=2099693 RepID=UPI00287FAF86|nr:helix-turn-helix domain-containing protein [Mycobacterium sp. ITM-2016-00318]WNG94991.1 helix-turn-helix domain-containing protein [Mycobacterium sp. ITM-2016-00318]
MNAAREVFSECGYDGTNLAEVARRAGVSRPALNYHFADKPTMYNDVITSTYTGVVAPAINRAAQETGLVRQLSVFVEAACSAIAQDRSVLAFLCTSVADCETRPELRDPDHCPLTIIRRFLTWAVKDAVERGELSSATRVQPLADALAAMLWGIGFFGGFVGTPRETGAAAAEMQQFLTGTLWATPPK